MRRTGFTYVITVTGIDERGVLDQRQHIGRGRTGLQRTARRLLDHAPVHHGIGEREAHLDRVGAGVLEAAQQLGVDAGEPAGHVRGEQRRRPPPCGRAAPSRGLPSGRPRSPSAASTVSRSLSPRPDRQTRMREPSGSGRCRSHPITWLGSRAGRMPSVRASAWKPCEGVLVGGGYVAGKPRVVEVGVLGPHSRVVQPGRDRMGLDHLALARPAAGRTTRRGTRRAGPA